MTRFLSIAALAFTLHGTAVTAQDTATEGARHSPVVVELFTSQGCAACPPADEMMAELAGHEDVIALSLHVDYWNYLGWEDTFSQAAFTERQYGYGHAAGSTMVYTPQIIIGGMHPVMGARAMEVVDYIATHRATPDPVVVSVSQSGAVYRVEARWVDVQPAPEMVVQLVAYSPHETVDIVRGENAGRVAEYHNVAMTWQVVATWDGASEFATDVEADGELPKVVIVQSAGHGPILGAARLE